MNCPDIVACFTDYLDGVSEPSEQVAIEEHMQHCRDCTRYMNVLLNGAELLRSLPELELKDDFKPRLEHRLYHVDDERAIAVHAGSRTQVMTVLGIALLLTGVAWSPTLFVRPPAVELPAIVVDKPPLRGTVYPLRAMPIGVRDRDRSESGSDLDESLWVDQLIYDYSPLSDRYERRQRVRRVGQFAR